jgi:hypothetical protein
VLGVALVGLGVRGVGLRRGRGGHLLEHFIMELLLEVGTVGRGVGGVGEGLGRGEVGGRPGLGVDSGSVNGLCGVARGRIGIVIARVGGNSDGGRRVGGTRVGGGGRGGGDEGF